MDLITFTPDFVQIATKTLDVNCGLISLRSSSVC